MYQRMAKEFHHEPPGPKKPKIHTSTAVTKVERLANGRWRVSAASKGSKASKPIEVGVETAPPLNMP